MCVCVCVCVYVCVCVRECVCVIRKSGVLVGGAGTKPYVLKRNTNKTRPFLHINMFIQYIVQ